MILILPLLIVISLALSSCYSLGYYAHSLTGELELLAKRQPISSVVNADHTPDSVKQKLGTVLAVRKFASAEIGLPENDSYLSYSDIKRKFVVWNVFATPEFSLKPLNWCFPIVGCMSYLGYFSEEWARNSARELAAKGNDVHVGGVVAYSTLGWFADPVLNTMLRWDDAQLAQFVIHELTHQRMFVRDDTNFNEAFATTVARAGVRRWLARNNDQSAIEEFNRQEQREQNFVSMVLDTKQKLERLYAADAKAETTRRRKHEFIEELKNRYADLRAAWGGYRGYDAWIHSGVNNAKISSVATYHHHEKAFQRLFDIAAEDFQTFFKLAGRIGQMNPTSRSQCLGYLAGTATETIAACPTAISEALAKRHPDRLPDLAAADAPASF